MAIQNATQSYQGSTITLEVSYRTYQGGPLVDPDETPTYTITNPSGTIMETGEGTNTAIGKYSVTYTIANDAETSDTWKIAWVAKVGGFTVPDNWEYFEVLNGTIINTTWLNHIKKVTAYPDSDNILLTDDQIKTLIVNQALHDYFVKFPKKSWSEYNITNELSIDFPDTLTFGVLDCRILGKGYAGTTTGSFWEIVSWQQSGFQSNFNNMYGSKVKGYNPNGLRQQRFSEQQVNSSLVNQGTFKYRVDAANRVLYMYSSMSAKANITWAKYSTDFADVAYQFQWDVINLAQGYLLLHLADTTGIIDDSVLEAKIDTAALKERGLTLIEQVKEKWLEYVDPISIRQ